tara:strand:+ start:303 stop:725 length:423 start_codon:yes stop_codon:yes gene_type:complete
MVDEKKEVSISEEVKELGYYDAEALANAQESYGDSWKKRGGVGAFMMLARKWDRIENQTKKFSYNIFDAIHNDPSPTGIIDDIGDLRRYLFLVEAEIRRELGGFPLDAPQSLAEANRKPSDPTALGSLSKGNRLGFTEGS